MSGINKYVDEGGVPLIGYDGDSMIDIESEADGDTYLRTVARLTELKYFDQIHEYEVRRHCLLRIIPPFWYYWRFLFIRFNWFVVFILYLSFVIILPAVGAGFGVKTYRTPSIFRLEGFGCLNVPNLTFEYYFQLWLEFATFQHPKRCTPGIACCGVTLLFGKNSMTRKMHMTTKSTVLG
jgi:hypothetical protein